MKRNHQPPSTRFSPNGTAQAKAAGAVAHAPPPTKFGSGSGGMAQAKAAGAVTHAPPPTKFGSGSGGSAQAKVAGAVVHAPPPTKFGSGGSAQAKAAGAVVHAPPPTTFQPQARHAAPPAGAVPQKGVAQPFLPGSLPLVTRPSTIQRMEVEEPETETLEQRVIRILARRNIAISNEEAAFYASELTSHEENTLIPVKGRHRALKLNRAGVVSSVEWRPPSDASRMRVSPYYGPVDERGSKMLTMGPRPLTGTMIRQDATISSRDLGDIPPRPGLAGVMGGSAAQVSRIQNSEWLHLIAHSLGGPDTPANLVAGPHSLNTAMIPFERCVRVAVRKGMAVDYSVTFFADNMGTVSYVHHVEITISFPGGKKGTWTLEVNPDSPGEFINGGVLSEIEGVVEAFAS